MSENFFIRLKKFVEFKILNKSYQIKLNSSMHVYLFFALYGDVSFVLIKKRIYIGSNKLDIANHTHVRGDEKKAQKN